MIDKPEAGAGLLGMHTSLDGPAVLPNILGIAVAGGVRAEAGERDGEVMESLEMLPQGKARAAGIPTACGRTSKRSARAPLAERGAPEARPDIIWI